MRPPQAVTWPDLDGRGAEGHGGGAQSGNAGNSETGAGGPNYFGGAGIAEEWWSTIIHALPRFT